MFIKDSVILLLLLLITGAAKCCDIFSKSPTCDHFHEIQRSLDHNVDPCEDFYAHACNNWAMEHSSTEYNTTLGEVDYRMNLKLITVMESFQQQSLVTTKQNVFNKSYIYYRSCVSEKVRNVWRYFEVIKPDYGLEWPLLEELQAHLRADTDFTVKAWPAKQFNLVALLGKLHGHGFKSSLVRHFMESTQQGIAVSLEVPLNFPGLFSWVEEDELIELPFLTMTLKGLGLPPNSAQKYTENILNTRKYFETLSQQSGFKHLTGLSYMDLKQQYPEISLFLENMLPQHILENDIHSISVDGLDYFISLATTQWSAQEEHDVCNYLMMVVLNQLLAGKSNDLTKLKCIKDVRNDMDFPINLLYYQYIYKPEEMYYNADVNNLFGKARDYLIEAIRENVQNFTPQYLEQWQTKLSAITLNLGNTPRRLDSRQIQNYFRDLPDLVLNNYYENHLHFLRHRFLKSLPLNTAKSHANSVGSSSTPFYDAELHMMVLPLGFLQPPVYHHTFDPIFKWSMLGFQLTLDFTRALALGASKLIIDSADVYLRCIIKESLNKLMAYIPEMVAARVAYRAYISEQNFELYPQFAQTNWKKLFFLNLSQYFCVHRDNLYKSGNADCLNHVVSNLEDFPAAFGCPVDAGMYRNETCRLF